MRPCWCNSRDLWELRETALLFFLEIYRTLSWDCFGNTNEINCLMCVFPIVLLSFFLCKHLQKYHHRTAPHPTATKNTNTTTYFNQKTKSAWELATWVSVKSAAKAQAKSPNATTSASKSAFKTARKHCHPQLFRRQKQQKQRGTIKPYFTSSYCHWIDSLF